MPVGGSEDPKGAPVKERINHIHLIRWMQKEEKNLDPERSSFSDGGELGRLEVRET